MTFTIAMPIFNGAQYLVEAVRSVLSQTRGDFELIFSDDGSTDGSVELLQQLSKEAPAGISVRMLPFGKQAGLTRNWNRCVEAAEGDVVILFHQDDVLEPWYLSGVERLLTQHPDSGLIHSAFTRISGAGEVLNVSPMVPEYESGEMFVRRLLVGNFVCCPSVAIRREVYRNVGLFDRRFKFSVDHEMWCRIGLRYAVGCLPAPSVRYRVHEGQETSRLVREEDSRRRLEQFIAPLVALRSAPIRNFRNEETAKWQDVLGEIRAAVRKDPGAASWALRMAAGSSREIVNGLVNRLPWSRWGG